MNDVERLLQRLGDADDPRLTQLSAAVMGRIAHIPRRASDGGILRWGAATAVAALVIGSAAGSLDRAAAASPQPLPFAALDLAPSTLLASPR